MAASMPLPEGISEAEYVGSLCGSALELVNAITHRRDLIFPIGVPGRATEPDETHTMIGTLASAEARQLLQDAGLPVKQVFTLSESQVIWAAIQVDRTALSRLRTNAQDFRKTVATIVFRHKSGMHIHRLLVVGEDIDPSDFGDVM